MLIGGAAVGRESHVAQASPRAPSTGETLRASVVKRVAKKALRDVTEGHLEHPARLASLFERLQALEAHQAQAVVRVVQFGDSHTASDYGTSVARARLARRFGDGGRGFIPMGQPYRRLFQAGELVSRGVGFEPIAAASAKSGAPPDGFFGPTGIAMDGRAAGAFLGSELSASADRLEIAYLAQPGGGSFDVYVDGRNRGRVATEQSARAAAFREFPVSRGPHSLEARAVGDGAVRIFGVRLDDQAVGVTWDSLGINGAKATTLLDSDESHFGEQLAHIAPALAIVAYGTNESGDSTTTPDDHHAAIRALVARAKVPGAECIVLGPPDRGARTLPKLVDMIAAQRRYAVVAQALVDDLVAAYETWKRETAAPPTP